MRITFLPGFRNTRELIDVLVRAGFYFADIDAAYTFQVEFTPPDVELLDKTDIPDGYDPLAVERAKSIADQISFTSSPSDTRRAAHESDAVMVWNRERLSEDAWEELVDELRTRGIRMYAVDRMRDRLEGSQYIQARFDGEGNADSVVGHAKDRFRSMVESNSLDTVSLLGTGPSIGNWRSHDFDNTLVIACNTTILDDELMDKVRPRIITFADPIFHFGCSIYAARFRQALKTLAERMDFEIVIPLKYQSLFVSLCPRLADRTIAIPMTKRRPNVNLLEEFEVKVTANIATLLMIPIASSLGTRVQMLGFDGRGASETYFWRHNPRTQLQGELEIIKSVHPAFFTEVDHDDYYDDHLAELERLLIEGEVEGKSYKSLESTHLTPLRKRSTQLDENALERAIAKKAAFRVISLNPDYEDDFGHYGAYDARLRQVIQDAGGDLITLVSTGYEGDAGLWVIPAFTDPSWSLGRTRWKHHSERFQRELSTVLRVLARSERKTPTVLIMYMASPRHLVEATLLASELLASAPLVANLFHSHKEMWKLEAGQRVHSLTGLALIASRPLQKAGGLFVRADSRELAELITRHHGVELPLWPMFSFTSLSAQSTRNHAQDEASQVIVYAPGNMQLDKGYDLVARLSERLTTTEPGALVRLRARIVVREGTDRKLLKFASILKEHADVIEGVLDDEKYARYLDEADVILVPYRKTEFETRTSAVIADAMKLGKPIVTTADTWMGRVVTEAGSGETFVDGDVDDMERALKQVISNLDSYKSQAHVSSLSWRRDTGIREFAEFLKGLAKSPRRGRLEVTDTLRAIADVFDAAAEAAGYEPKDPDLEDRLRESQVELRRLRSQLRAAKSSVGYRFGQGVARILRTDSPIYRAVRTLGHRLFSSGPDKSDTETR